jgi:hypothetical protein
MLSVMDGDHDQNRNFLDPTAPRGEQNRTHNREEPIPADFVSEKSIASIFRVVMHGNGIMNMNCCRP